MKRTMGRMGVAVLGLLVNLAAVGFGRSKDDQDFPDYNHLEYAKPMPPADQQVEQPPPGSIHMEVGGKKQVSDDTPLDELPVSLRPTQHNDTSEPSMDFFDNGVSTSPAPVAPIAPVASTAPPAAKL